MIGEFITRSLVLVLGYAYPAFQCFKTVEKNRVEIPELRFWCQYWILVAAITVFERIGDIFVSWLPMYGEMKLALFIYLWYPKTKGTGYVYETFLRPYVSKHETDIDRSLLEFRERAWNFAIYYWHNCTEFGSTKILQLLQFVASQSGRIRQPPSSKNVLNEQPIVAPPPPPPPTPPTTPSRIIKRSKSDMKRPPIPPPGRSLSNLSQSPRAESIQVHLHNQTQFIRPADVLIPDSDNGKNGLESKSVEEDDLHAARLRLRRFVDGNSSQEAQN